LNYTRTDRHCMGADAPLATGSVIVAEANNRFYEPAPERNVLLGVTAELKF